MQTKNPYLARAEASLFLEPPRPQEKPARLPHLPARSFETPGGYSILLQVDRLLEITKRAVGASSVGLSLVGNRTVDHGVCARAFSGTAHGPCVDTIGNAVNCAESCLGLDRPVACEVVRTPVVSADGQALGTLRVCRTPGHAFSTYELEMIHTMAGQIGTALVYRDFARDRDRERAVFSAIQQNIHEGVLVLDEHGVIIASNRIANTLLDLDASDLKFKTFLRRHRNSLRGSEALESALLAYAEGRETRPVELVKDFPQHREILARTFAVAAPEDKTWVGIALRDITEERSLLQRRDTLVSVASHELRTAMTTITGCSEMALHPEVTEGHRRKWMKWIHSESKRISDLADHLLSVSRIQLGQTHFNAEPVALPDAAKQAIRAVQPARRQHRIVTQFPEALPHVLADREKLGQVLINLLTNAVKYSPRGGTIALSAEVEDEELLVSVHDVHDEGIGIAAGDQPPLFSTFHRAKNAETPHIRGTGLGLHIVRSLIELMGGQVLVQSEPPEGWTFRFTIPIA